MPYRIRFVTDLFTGPDDTADSEALIQDALNMLTNVDIRYLRTHPNTPLLYESGVRYKEEIPGEEDWQDIPTSLQNRIADCEDLAAWRAAEVNVRYGIPAYPIFSHRTLPNGDIIYHIRVKYPKSRMFPNGHIEDPSRVLGMTGPRQPLPRGTIIGEIASRLMGRF